MGKLWRHYAVWNMDRGDGMPGGFETPIQYFKGVGQRRAELYHKLGIETVRQLLWHFPRSYVNFGENTEIASVESDQICSVRAMVMSKSGEQRIRKGLSIFKVTAADDTAEITLVFYNTKYAVEALSIGQEYFFLWEDWRERVPPGNAHTAGFYPCGCGTRDVVPGLSPDSRINFPDCFSQYGAGFGINRWGTGGFPPH